MHAIVSLTYELRNLILEPSYHKIQEKPSSIDLILTNNSSGFQNSCAIETLTVLRGDYGYEDNLSEVKTKTDLLLRLQCVFQW